MNTTVAFSSPVPVLCRVARFPWQVALLLTYLGAITIFGKGPTYLIYPPIYWGELVLIASVLWAVSLIGFARLFTLGPATVTAVVTGFLLVGLTLAAAGLPEWRLQAIRDAACCYYALLFFVGLAVASHEHIANRFWQMLVGIWICAVCWGSADLASGHRLSNLGPELPWRGVTILSNSGSELGQNVALGCVLLLSTWLAPRKLPRGVALVLAIAGLGVFLASYGRGQKVGFMAALITAGFLSLGQRRTPRFPLRLWGCIAAGVVFAVVLAVSTDLDIAKATQIDRFADASPTAEEGTAYWRMVWWKNLYAVVMSENALFGLGFGLNLALYNPYLAGTEDQEWTARSPHNINITIFARMGLVGLALWTATLLIGIGRLCMCAWQGHIRGRVYTPQRREELFFWIMLLVTTWLNSSFGVLMEGPALGYWFWFGLGFATMRSLRTGHTVAMMEFHPRVQQRVRSYVSVYSAT